MSSLPSTARRHREETTNSQNDDNSTTTTTTTIMEPVAKKTKIDEEEDEEKEENDPRSLLLTKTDIWVHKILPFLGIGNYIFVAGICKHLKQFYQEYYSLEEKKDKLPEVYTGGRTYGRTRKLLLTDTLYSGAFASLSRAKFWEENTKEGNRRDRLRDNRICETIAKYGNISTLEWAHKQREFPWDRDTCFYAAKAGRLDILQYAHDNGCPWDSDICREAAKLGRLDILKYARDNGCPWDKWTLLYAIRDGHQEIVEYARANGCPEPQPNMI